MSTARHHRLVHWVLLFALLLGLAPAALPGAARAQDATPAPGGQGGVGPYRSEFRLAKSAYGPESGTLAHDPDKVATAFAGLNLQNFYASVRVTVPYDDQDWDAGYSFRFDRDNAWQAVIESTGRWFVALGGVEKVAEGTVDNLKLGVGDVNQIELVADGTVGYLAVNRKDAGSFDLSRRGVSGDIAVGTTYTQATTKAGASMEFARFQVWELPATPPAQPSADAVRLMEQGRDLADTERPIAGPSDGSLTEVTDSITVDKLGVESADFYVRATVTNPRDGAKTPFDVGFGFRDTGGDNQYRIAFVSDGSWYFKYGAGAILAAENFAGLKTAKGDDNLYELAVQGDLAVFAVNGQVAGAVDVSSSTDAGDIALGVGFYNVDSAGDSLSYQDFAAWSLEGNAGPGPSATPGGRVTPDVTAEATVEATREPSPETTREPVPPVSTEEVTAEPTTRPAGETPSPADGAAAFADAMDRTRSLLVAFGPEKGDLTLEPDSLAFATAGVSVRNFIAQAELVNPYAPTANAPWDYGFLFRLGEDQSQHFRLIVVSTGDWYFGVGTQDPIQTGTLEGIRTAKGQRNRITLVVQGDTGYFGFNDQYVATLDLSAVSGAGDIALGSSFFQGSYQDGAVTSFEDFIIWSLDEEEPPASATAEPSPSATATGTAEAPSSPVAGNTYTSSDFGYSVTFGDAWSVEDQDGAYVRLTNGVSTVDFYAFTTEFTPAQCLDDEFAFYQDANQGFSNAQVALDVNNNEMRGQIDDYEWGVYWFTFTGTDGKATDYTSYVECRPLTPGVLLKIVQFVPSDQYNDEIQARVDLLKGLSLTGAGPGGSPTAEAPATATATREPAVVTPEPTVTAEATTAGGESAMVRIEAIGQSGIEGLATLDPAGRRTRVRLLLIGAPDGTIAIIQEGTCTNLSGSPAFLLNPVNGGLSETTLPADLQALLEGGYVITVHTGLTNLNDPLACGPIGRG